MDGIRDIAWESTEPLELLQARKAHELATREGAGEFAGSIYREAGEKVSDPPLWMPSWKLSKSSRV